VVLAGSEEFLNAYEEQKGRRRLIYRVREGDSLSSISRRFGLSVGSIMRINQFDRKAKLQPGQPVVVYVDAAQFSPRKKTEVRQRSDTESAENVAEKTLSTSDLDVSSNTISKIASDAIPKRDEQSANNSPPIKSKSRPLRSPELEEIDSLSNTDAASSINVP
jgi:LysM repeat protein